MGKRNTKGLFMDTRPVDQPQDTYAFGKNGIQNYQKLAIFNEPGFTISSASIPYTVNGVVETDTTPIIFSTDDTNSAIGFFDPVTDTYIPIFDDTALAFKIGFKKANYITGEYQKDRTGAYIVVFTDKVLPLRYLNCTTPGITKAEDMLFFLRANAPAINVATQSGGQLATGSYVIYVKYAKIDGSETPYLTSSPPIVVSGVDGSGLSSEAIAITLTGCDTSYDYIVIGVLMRIAGVTTAAELSFINLTPTVNILYSGDQTITNLDPEELIIPPAVYKTVGTLTQLNDQLFLGNLSTAQQVNIQKYAGLIQVRWTSQMIDMTSIPPNILSGLRKGFAHGETYALYYRLNMIDGSKSQAFPIAGRTALSGETDVITDGGITAKRFQLHDTVVLTNPTDRSGTPGFWVNSNENYPDTDDYDSSAIGGPNLRNQPVRHHKMPTHNWIATHFNSGDATYGRTRIDILGLQLSGIVIPADILPLVDSYEILYAKRSTGNMTVLGQSMVYNSAQSLKLLQSGAQTTFTSSGGNWNTVADISTFRDINDPKENPLFVVADRVRMHPFELLFNKIEIPQTGCYLQYEWKIRFVVGPDSTYSFGVDTNIANGDRVPSDILPVIYLINAEDPIRSTITPCSSSDFIRGCKSIQYAPNNTNLGQWDNLHLDTAVVTQLFSNAPAINTSEQHVAVGKPQMGNQNTGKDYVQFEESYLATLRVVRDNVYQSFLSQSLIRTGQTFNPALTATTPIYAGDTFPCDYSFNNYGWTSADDGATGQGNQEDAGVKVMRRSLCESTANINSRFAIPGNIYSQWWPQSPISYLNTFIAAFARSLDPNQFGYSKDLNSLNEFENIQVFNPFQVNVYSYPDRIHRGGAFKRDGYPSSWRTLLPLDYYDVRRDRGVIVNLAGLDDNLLIHLEAALIVTQDKTTLKGDVLSVTLGTADIFQYAPLEAVGTKLGYGGTHHDLACLITPMGYVFIDNISGQAFVFKGTLKLLNDGINTFFKQYLKLNDLNPFIGNGITLGYDPDFNRMLMTVKNLQLLDNANIVPGYQETQAFFDALSQGISIVYNKGTWMTFMGDNTTEFDCPTLPEPPTIENATFTIPEDTAIGTTVHNLVASDPQDLPLTYLILTGNVGAAFNINPSGQVMVNNSSINFLTLATYTLGVRVIDTLGLSGDATVTVHITQVIKRPSLPDYSVAILSGSANGTMVNTEVGTDPNSLTLSYSILSGNGLGAFAINSSTGVVTVVDTTKIDYRTAPLFSMVMQATNGTLAITANLTVTITPVYDVPTGSGANINILDSTAPLTIVMTPTPPTDLDVTEGTGSLVLSIQSETIPGAFTVGFDPLDTANYFVFKMAATTVLDPAITVTYSMVIRAANQGDLTKFIDLTYNITVLYDPSTLESRPYEYTCNADTVLRSDYLIQSYIRTTDPGTGDTDIMQPPYAPNDSPGYTYAYQSIATGHQIFSFFFLFRKGLPGFNYLTNGFGDYIVATLTNNAMWPSSPVSLVGTSRGKALGGYIDTSGNIHINSNDAGAIFDSTGQTDNTSVIRLFNLTYASEFTTEGIIV